MKTVTISRLPAGRLDEYLARDEAKGVRPFARVLYEDDGLEGAAPLGREGVDQHLDRRVQQPIDGQIEEHSLAPAQHSPPHHVPGDDPHDQDDGHRGEEAQAEEGAARSMLRVQRSEEVVDAAPEDPEEPGGGDGGDGHEEARPRSDS